MEQEDQVGGGNVEKNKQIRRGEVMAGLKYIKRDFVFYSNFEQEPAEDGGRCGGAREFW